MRIAVMSLCHDRPRFLRMAAAARDRAVSVFSCAAVVPDELLMLRGVAYAD